MPSGGARGHAAAPPIGRSAGISDARTGKTAYRDGVVNSQEQVGVRAGTQVRPCPADADHDGIPDYWETEHGLDPNDPSDANKDFTGDGYTNLEKYLDSLVRRDNAARNDPFSLNANDFKQYVDDFNPMEDENVVNLVPNWRESWDWMKQNAPAFPVSGQAVQGDLLLSLVDLSQAHQADARLHGPDRVSHV